MMFAVREKFDEDIARQVITDITNFFETHPRRRVCRLEYFKVRRKHIWEDTVSHIHPDALPARKVCSIKKYREQCIGCEKRFKCWTA